LGEGSDGYLQYRAEWAPSLPQVIGLPVGAAILVAAVACVILSVLAWVRWGCLATIILGLTLIPAAALMLGYGVAFAATVLSYGARSTQQPAAAQRQCRLHGEATTAGVTLDYRGQLPEGFCQLPRGSPSRGGAEPRLATQRRYEVRLGVPQHVLSH
jgi:hypothetical protein